MPMISAQEAKAIVNKTPLQKELENIYLNIRHIAENGKTTLLINNISNEAKSQLKELGYMLIFDKHIGYTIIW